MHACHIDFHLSLGVGIAPVPTRLRAFLLGLLRVLVMPSTKD